MMEFPENNIQPQLGVGGAAASQPTPNSTPPSSGGIAQLPHPPVGTEANESQGGGVDLVKDRGLPDENFAAKTRSDPDGQMAVGQQTANSIVATRKNNSGQTSVQGNQINEHLEGQGVPVKKSFEEMEAQILKELTRGVEDKKLTKAQASKTRRGWRKIFNTINEDEMGLFLMDFGMRSMMAGEQMGSLAALGSAGSGAMGALQGRRQQATDQKAELGQVAHERALSQYGAESTRMGALASGKQADAAGKQADAAVTRAATAAGGYKGEKSWLYDLLVTKMGKSEEEFLAVINRDTSAAERKRKLFDYVRELRSDVDYSHADESGMLFKDYTTTDMKEWVESQLAIENNEQSDSDRALEKYGPPKN